MTEAEWQALQPGALVEDRDRQRVGELLGKEGDIAQVGFGGSVYTALHYRFLDTLPCRWPCSHCNKSCTAHRCVAGPGSMRAHYCDEHRPRRLLPTPGLVVPQRPAGHPGMVVALKIKEALKSAAAYAFAEACQSLAEREFDSLELLAARVAQKRRELHELCMRELSGCPLCGPVTCSCSPSVTGLT